MNWFNNTRGTKHKHYRNSETERVQKRIDSAMDPHRARIVNSLAVESMQCIVYKRSQVGLPCSCSVIETATDEDHSNGVSDMGAYAASSKRNEGLVSKPDGILEDSDSGLFGGTDVYTDDVQDVSVGSRDIDLSTLVMRADTAASPEDMGDAYEDLGFGGNVINCPICYREGFLPPYQPIGFNYLLLTHHNVVNMEGFFRNVRAQPNQFEKLVDGGFVEFGLMIPKYFKSATWSIRNAQGELLPAGEKPVLVVNGLVRDLTYAALDSLRGKRASIRVTADVFSHVLIIFDAGANPVLCNISEETKTLDYDKELTVSNLTIVLPWNVGELNQQDLLVLPKRNYVLLITETPQKRNADNKTWEWVVQTRTVQRKEMWFNIHKGYKIL